MILEFLSFSNIDYIMNIILLAPEQTAEMNAVPPATNEAPPPPEKVESAANAE